LRNDHPDGGAKGEVMELFKNIVTVTTLLLVGLQSCIWILTPKNEGTMAASFFNAWGRTVVVLMHVFGIQPGRDRKLVLLTWVMVPACVFGLVVLSPAFV